MLNTHEVVVKISWLTSTKFGKFYYLGEIRRRAGILKQGPGAQRTLGLRVASSNDEASFPTLSFPKFYFGCTKLRCIAAWLRLILSICSFVAFPKTGWTGKGPWSRYALTEARKFAIASCRSTSSSDQKNFCIALFGNLNPGSAGLFRMPFLISGIINRMYHGSFGGVTFPTIISLVVAKCWTIFPNEWLPVVSNSELANFSMSAMTSSQLENEISLRFCSDISNPFYDCLTVP